MSYLTRPLAGVSLRPINICRFSLSFQRRTFASHADVVGLEKPKAKPKATTTLRRSALDSQSIREQKSGIQTVFTLATAEKYLLSRLRGNPALPSTARALNDAWWVPKWGREGHEGEVFVFGNGSFVCWGMGEADAERFAQEVIDRTPGMVVGSLKEPETEELEFLTDSAERTRLQGDLIILGQTEQTSPPAGLPSMVFPPETLLARYAYSQALSRSTALSALEVSLDEYLSSMALLPHTLEQTGRPGLGRKALIKKLGQLMKFRQGLNLNRENFSDIPDFYWTEPEPERYFKSLSDALEVKARTDAVNEKIDYAGEAQSVLRQLLTESSSHNLELIIIALIAVEVVVVFIRDGPELWDLVTGEEKKEV